MTAPFTSNEPRLLPPKQAGPDYELSLHEDSKSFTIDAGMPRLAPIKSDTPGVGEYDPERAAPGDHRGPQFGLDKKTNLPFTAASTDAIYYHDEIEEKLGLERGKMSAPFTSNEPRLLPPKQAGPDYELSLQKGSKSFYIEPVIPRLASTVRSMLVATFMLFLFA